MSKLPELKTTPESCYVFIHASPGQRVGLVRQGTPGWLVVDIDQKDMTDAEAKCVVEVLNAVEGISTRTAARMLLLAGQGWRCPHLEVLVA